MRCQLCIAGCLGVHWRRELLHNCCTVLRLIVGFGKLVGSDVLVVQGVAPPEALLVGIGVHLLRADEKRRLLMNEM